MLFDSHTHIHFPAYDADREAVIKRAIDAGVHMITVGTQTSSSDDGVKLARQYPRDIWATVGFHPNHVVDIGHSAQEEHKIWHHDENEQEADRPEKFDIEFLRQLAQDQKVVAIGECGLDYYRLPQISNLKSKILDLQKEVFLKQIALAQELNKALMIHCRPSYIKNKDGKQESTNDAYNDLLVLMENGKWKMPKIIHFYVGGLQITKKFIAAGFYFTFGGVITFARDYDEIIRLIPLEQILLETDAPYVAPLVYRGQRNEPAFIIETAKKMAELKGVSYEKISEIVTANAKKVFKI